MISGRSTPLDSQPKPSLNEREADPVVEIDPPRGTFPTTSATTTPRTAPSNLVVRTSPILRSVSSTSSSPDLPRGPSASGNVVETGDSLLPYDDRRPSGLVAFPTSVHRDVSAPSMPVSVSCNSNLTLEAYAARAREERDADAGSRRSPSSRKDVEPPPSPTAASSHAPVQEQSASQLYAKAERLFDRSYRMNGQADPAEAPHGIPIASQQTSLDGWENDWTSGVRFSISTDGAPETESEPEEPPTPFCSRSQESASTGASSGLPEPDDAELTFVSNRTSTGADGSTLHSLSDILAPSERATHSIDHTGSPVKKHAPMQPIVAGQELSGLPTAFLARELGAPWTAEPAKGLVSRPRTAESIDPVTPSSSPSKKRGLKGPPTPIKTGRPTTAEPDLKRIAPWQEPNTDDPTHLLGASPCEFPTAPPTGPASPRSITVGARLRARAASTGKLRPTSPLKTLGDAIPQLPSLPQAFRSARIDPRPSTAQPEVDSSRRGRMRSRTVGEVERPISLQPAAHEQMHAAMTDEWRNHAASTQPASATGPLLRSRRPSRADTTSSSVHSGQSFLQTPQHSSFNLSSTSSLHRPSTPKSPARPKSRGDGWASHLASGVTLHIDQEGHRSALINMTYLSYDPFGRPESLLANSDAASRPPTPKRPKSRGDRDSKEEQVGILEFGMVGNQSWPYHHSIMEAAPILRHLTIGTDTKGDLLSRQAALAIRNNGVHAVSGSERKGKLAWRFVYAVEDRANSDGKLVAGDKVRRRNGSQVFHRRQALTACSVTCYQSLRPISFSCSATLLDPHRARKSRLLTMVRKQVVPNLSSTPVSPLPSPPQQTAHLPSSLPSPSRSHPSMRMSSKESLSSVHRAPSAASSQVSKPIGNWAPSAVQRVDPSTVVVPRNLPPTVVPFRLSRKSGTSLSSAGHSHSQPSTPNTPVTPLTPSVSPARVPLTTSPTSSKFGDRLAAPAAIGRKRGVSLGEASRADPMGQAGMRRPSNTEMRVTDIGLEPAPVLYAGTPLPSPVGRKLVPIQIPPELRNILRVDPASDGIAPPTEQPTQVTPRKTSATRPRANTSSGTPRRPPTASEAIKAEYLAREKERQENGLRSARTCILTPDSFPTGDRPRRLRSRTDGDDKNLVHRPYTADPASAFPAHLALPLRELALGVESGMAATQSGTGAGPALGLSLVGRTDTTTTPRRADPQLNRSRSREHLQLGEAFSVSSLPPRRHLRPRTAQTLAPVGAQSTGAVLIDFSPPRVVQDGPRRALNESLVPV